MYFLLVLFPIHAQTKYRGSSSAEGRMVIKILASAISGGMMAAGYSAAGSHGIGHALLCYELGGIIAVMLVMAFAVENNDFGRI
jgi:hypothetical protein